MILRAILRHIVTKFGSSSPYSLKEQTEMAKKLVCGIGHAYFWQTLTIIVESELT